MELTKNIFFNTDKLIENTPVRISYTGKFYQDDCEKVTIVDNSNYFSSDNVEGALNELAIELNGQRLRGINIANTIIDKLEG